ncbi:hypothetical protein HWV62_19035 [Athelia sp. TMB]|nr:hypothetical protein HWV62_19035 [Athelia sp. TMB]
MVRTAVYAYCVLANYVPYATTFTNLTISMDSEVVGQYMHIPTSSTAFQYDVPVYVNTTLSNAQHTLTLETQGTNASLILFDYAIYTYDSDPIPSSSSSSPSSSASSSTKPAASPSPSVIPPNVTPHHSNIAAIAAGAAVGAIALLIATSALLFLCRKRRNRPARVVIDADEEKPGPAVLAGTGLEATAYNPYGEHHAEAAEVGSSTAFMASPHISTQPPSSVPSSHTLPTSTSGEPMPPGGMVVRSPPAPGSKAAQRQEEIAIQVRAREQELATLQRRQGTIRRPESSAPSSVSPPSSASGGETEASMANQVELLKQEVEKLQAQQRQMLWEMNAAPPPQYS